MKIARHILCQLKVGDSNFLRDDAHLLHCESEYAVLMATKKLADGATYFISITWTLVLLKNWPCVPLSP